jgi:hypothetical protein
MKSASQKIFCPFVWNSYNNEIDTKHGRNAAFIFDAKIFAQYLYICSNAKLAST